jgi:hypothetical protein
MGRVRRRWTYFRRKSIGTSAFENVSAAGLRVAVKNADVIPIGVSDLFCMIKHRYLVNNIESGNMGMVSVFWQLLSKVVTSDHRGYR